ncbi:glutathione S-transferase [Mangrovicoccus algicola]|uniref:Glutathione S-transferase n=1 Tax=Mangrovicoccus algicola TaxID=2771008 RepID=A0A8J6Z390_9RHOB|nr:glutathione S-transferase [Mangrovicoccus algicola]MBE3636639.1 glutathione S-transferase [Mangrovicoccus algicola]
MSYDLHVGHASYSSWSLRAWLLLHRYGLAHRLRRVDIYEGGKAADLAALHPADTVPVLVLPDGTAVGDSLAIAETLAERHPAAGMWPADPAARATARWITAAMHSGFSALRGHCPMVLTRQRRDFVPPPGVLADLARIEALWSLARQKACDDGPWLFGSYSIADAFFAPVAMRIAGYGLPVAGAGRRYVNAHLADLAISRWRAIGADWPLARLPEYATAGAAQPWPRAI